MYDSKFLRFWELLKTLSNVRMDMSSLHILSYTVFSLQKNTDASTKDAVEMLHGVYVEIH